MIVKNIASKAYAFFFLQILNIPHRHSITQIVNIGGHLFFWDVGQLFFA